ncbi:MAG: hypothetical protein ACK5RJ_03495 [Burkholderiales bacterium]|jgi:hypothetical protein|nr:hypothetical protein [Rhodocyclaceae bacterium]MCA3023152.1 hypothetical protein [Rhodocyclaceae bacterium]MCA3052730.1 hypothetical protein [Rhodocyclaceae bacterium]MCA3057921.1 hypothetical protein [Rhodocyclaceae bacterium]MCE2724928.1 hypothetical protein [Betaproteobacteria bacterium]
MTQKTLPPRIAGITDGEVTWKQLEAIDYEALGYFLSCHLVIEHYIDEFLKIGHPTLDWDSARQSFGQKVALLSNLKFSDKYDCIPAIKHLNSIRNKLSHNIEFTIQPADLLPLTQYLAKVYEEKQELPTETKEILGEFTIMTSVLFAGYISGAAQNNKYTKD